MLADKGCGSGKRHIEHEGLERPIEVTSHKCETKKRGWLASFCVNFTFDLSPENQRVNFDYDALFKAKRLIEHNPTKPHIEHNHITYITN